MPDATYSLDIPAERLSDALQAFALAAHHKLLYSSKLVEGRRSAPLKGVFTTEEAIKRLLSGTNLPYKITPDGLIVIRAAGSTFSSTVGNAEGAQERSDVGRSAEKEKSPKGDLFRMAQVDPGEGAGAPLRASQPYELAPAGSQLQVVIVTAQHRAENIQDVPIDIQAITGANLKQMHVQNFDDLLNYVPNVTAADLGAAQSSVIMRGLYSDGAGWPNVAIYLDQQSGEAPLRPGENLDIYAADIDRVEVLEGPQGTLFGAGAEAGVLRYITNKPVLDATEAKLNAGYDWTTGGGPSTNVDATINVPIIQGTFALRGVVYDVTRGGYINNIPATFARAGTDKGIVDYFGGVVPSNSGPITNNEVAERHFNSVTYRGARFEALYKINEDWNALLMDMTQDIDAEGVAWEEAYDGQGTALPDLSVEQFNPDWNRDHFNDVQLTIEGRIEALRLVYVGGYLTRHDTQEADYTNYSRGYYASYYQCNYPGYPFTTNASGKIAPTPGSAGYCYSPQAYYTANNRYEHPSQELRLSTPDEWRLRATGGLYWEQISQHQNLNWFYGTSPNFYPIGPPSIDPATGAYYPATSNDPSVRPQGDAFFDDITYKYGQKAAYLSLSYDLLPKRLTLTLGTRYYRTTDSVAGASVGSFGCEIYGPYDGGAPPDPCVSTPANGVVSNINNLDAKHLSEAYHGFTSRVSLAWHITPHAMLYYTWSQGFRPGGFNRSAPNISKSSPLYGVWHVPIAYAPDTLVNNELGWKTEMFGRVRLNGAVYQEDWKNAQVSVYDPGVTGNLTFTTNGPGYRVRGGELDVDALLGRGFQLIMGAAVNSSAVVHNLSLRENSGQSIPDALNPFGPLGSPLSQSPPFKGNILLREEFSLGEYEAYWQAGATHTGGAYSTTNYLSTTLQGNSQRFYEPSYSTWNAAVGVSKGDWTAKFYGENLSNSRGQLFASYAQYVKSATIIRPRTYGIEFSYGFGP